MTSRKTASAKKRTVAKKKLVPITVIVSDLAATKKLKGPALMRAAGRKYRAQPGAPKKPAAKKNNAKKSRAKSKAKSKAKARKSNK